MRQGGTTQIVAPLTQTTTLLPDGEAHLGEVRSPNNDSWTMTYAAGGLLQTFVNPRQAEWVYTYGPDGRLRTDEDPTHATQRVDLVKDGLTREVEITSAEGRKSLYSIQQMLDGLKRRLVRAPDLSVDSTRVTFGKAFPYGQIETAYGASGDSMTAYPVRDARLGWFAPVDSVVVTQLPETGRTRTMTGSRKFTPTTYDSPTNTWNASVELNGHRWVNSYSAATRRFSWNSPLGRVTTVDLDEQGRPILASVPGIAPLRLAYHANGKLQHLQQGGRGWHYSYDALGNVTEIRDTLDRTTTFLEYDAVGRPHRQDLPGARTIRYGYDASDNLDTLITPAGRIHTFGYSLRDERSTYSPPAVAGVLDPVTRYFFDGDRLLERIERPDGSEVSLSWGASSGKLDALTQPRGATAFSYATTSGQLESVQSPDSVTVTYLYDGPLLRSEAWSGKVSGTVEYEHDIGFRDSVTTVTGTDGPHAATFHYDSDGMLDGIGSQMSLTRDPASGFLTGTQAGVVTSTVSYDAYGDPHILRYEWPSTGVFQQIIDRDSMGRVTRVTESGIASKVYEYHYDLAGRLDTVWVDGARSRAYEYDLGEPGNGNRTGEYVPDGLQEWVLSARGLYDEQDRLLRYGIPAAGFGEGVQFLFGFDTAYEYSAAGELSRKFMSDTIETRYTYDALGNLTGARLPNGDTLTYLIDGANRRVGRVVNGAMECAWLYGAGPAPLAELDSTGGVVNRYVYGSQSHAPDLLLADGVTFRMVTDYLGSVRAVVNTSTGEVVQRIDYDAWGVRTTDTAPEFQSLGFAGGLTDPATGLVRFGARDYDPAIGRWTAKDPIGFEGATSCYQYARACPTTRIDPTGLVTDEDLGMRFENGFPTPPLLPLFGIPKDLVDARNAGMDEADAYDVEDPLQEAVRHATATHVLACRRNRTFAFIVSIGYEIASIPKSYPQDPTMWSTDTTRDLLNNWAGSDPNTSIEELIRKGKLWGPDLRPIPPRKPK